MGWENRTYVRYAGGDGRQALERRREGRRCELRELCEAEARIKQRLEGAGPISPETAERLACDARRLTIQPRERDLVHSRIGRCASYAQQRALHDRSAHCQYPGRSAPRELEAHHLIPVQHGGKTELENLILLCPHHHKHLHDHHIRTSGSPDQPVFQDQARRAITANQPHAPPG